ncbi:MAG: aminodeoxychorismate synthase, component I [Planctomyces sp.]|nr:aminodeoxychorismate synthase, component I [Planctomyces sp.]
MSTVLPIDYQITPWMAMKRLADLPWPTLLESARFHPQRGRYSYVAAAPVKTWTISNVEYGFDPFSDLRESLASFPTSSGGPAPFEGGIIGLASYELGHCWERLPRTPDDAFTTPPLTAGLYAWCLCWDHLERNAWWVSPFEMASAEAKVFGLASIQEEVLSRLSSEFDDDDITHESTEEALRQAVFEAAPMFPESSRNREEYETQVEQVIDYIRAGDIYQANLSRKLHFEFPDGPLKLYDVIRKSNPAPFAAYFQPEADWALVSASPEQFLHLEGQQITTRPIKGTRPRWAAGDLDLLQALELRDAEKDRAENTMIVDLLRNDISRVCQIGSVRVPRWCQLETFERVHHLVSEVTGTLRDDADVWDLLAATFPGGSITGAPKIRAMEIISELEQTSRGAYCGSLFAVDSNGGLQSSILIRSLIWKQGWAQCPVGGGIVADSSPAAEYEETAHKSAGLIPSVKRSIPPVAQ